MSDPTAHLTQRVQQVRNVAHNLALAVIAWVGGFTFADGGEWLWLYVVLTIVFVVKSWPDAHLFWWSGRLYEKRQR